jgi:hypothetical protein
MYNRHIYIGTHIYASLLTRARRDSNPRQPDFFQDDKSPVLYLAELRAHISE